MDHIDAGIIFFEWIFITDEAIITVPLVCISTNTVGKIFTIFEKTDLFVDIFKRTIL